MKDDMLDMRGIAAVISRRRSIVLTIFGAALALAAIYSFLQPTQYAGTVSIRVQYPRGPNDTGSILPSDQMIQTQISTYAEIAKSIAVVQPVIDQLYANQADKPTYEEMAKQIEAKPVRGTEMLNLSILAGTPETAQKAANLLLASFNAKMTDIVRFQGKESRIFIGGRMEDAKMELDKAEKAMVSYKAKNQTISVSDQARSFVERQASLKRLEAENQVALATAWAKMSSKANVPDTPVLQQYRSRLADQESEMAGLRKNFTENHPKVITLAASLAETKAKLNSELSRVASGEVNLVQTQKAAIDRLSAQAESEMSLLPAREQGLARLMLDYNVAQELYVMLSKRYEDARISEVMQPTHVQVVDVAALPDKKAKPRWLLNLAIASILGLFAGLSMAFVADYFYKTIDSAEDVKRYLGQGIIGSIPSYSYQKEAAESWKSYRKTPFPQVVKHAEAKGQEG